MNVSKGLVVIACISFILTLNTGCSKRTQITAQQYNQWTKTEQALNTVSRGDLLILQGEKVCVVEENPSRGAFVSANCKDGAPRWKRRHDFAPHVTQIIAPSDEIYGFYASQYLTQ